MAQMSEKTKRILIRRKIREVVTIRHDEQLIFVCENCQSEQSFKSVDRSDAKFLNAVEISETEILPTEK